MQHPSRIASAMAEADQVERCSVLRSWTRSPAVMGMLLKGKLVLLRHPQLGRATLEDNGEIVAPLIQALGPLAKCTS